MKLGLWQLRFAVARRRYRTEMTLPEGPRAFVFLAADYGNLGDIAITMAQQRFLERALPNHRPVMVPISKTVASLDSIAEQIGAHDVITTIGGGNTGRVYPDIEALRRLVIKAFPGHPIIAFPQSIDLGVTPSRAALRRFTRPYRTHRQLTMCIRERRSYGMLSPMWDGRAGLLHVPDIVLSHPRSPGESQRRGAILSLRQDHEVSRDLADDEHLRAALADRFNTVAARDTELGCRFSNWDEAQAALEGHLEAYRGAELVVTDRLHGMIMAERVGTPCIALDNSNHKIGATYIDWLAGHPRVRFIRSIRDELEPALDAVLKGPQADRAMDETHAAFAPLWDALRRAA